MIPTLITRDGEGRPVGPAITWEDSRAEAEGAALRERQGGDALYRRTGQWVDGRYLLPMFDRIRREEPERAAATTVLASAKDQLFGWLTGAVATDPSTATGFGCFDLSTGEWATDLAEACGAALPGGGEAGRPELPPIVDPEHTAPLAGPAADRLGLPTGVPVAVGTADSVAGAFGLGADAENEVAYIAGTSTVILGVSAEPLFDPEHRFLVTPLAVPGTWGLEMDLVATGTAVAWLAGILGVGDEDDVMSLAEQSKPGAGGVGFIPYLGFGEQGALWDPDLRGAVTGLTLGARREDLARALLEGIVLESRRCLSVLEEAGLPRSPVRVGGRAAGSLFFLRALAGATGREAVGPSRLGEMASALGAARVASRTAGSDVGPPTAFPGRRAEPSEQEVETWATLWDRHERARKGVGR
jgi:sugar (pentulose or hexulose) kinase